MVNPIKTKYLVDTNILIGFSHWKPMSLTFNNQFWSEMEEALANKEWVLVDAVVDEVIYDIDLKKWCKEQVKKGLVDKITDDDRMRAVEINNQYKMIDQASGNSTVDTYLLAYAERNGYGIFSQESPRVNTAGLYKIPDVCDKLQISRIRKPKVFLKEIGFN
jgi:hypothetical protein